MGPSSWIRWLWGLGVLEERLDSHSRNMNNPWYHTCPVGSERASFKIEVARCEEGGFSPDPHGIFESSGEKRAAINCTGMEPFSTAASITGIELFSHWMMKKQRCAIICCGSLTEHRVQVVEYWVDTFGAERVRIVASRQQRQITSSHQNSFESLFSLIRRNSMREC